MTRAIAIVGILSIVACAGSRENHTASAAARADSRPDVRYCAVRGRIVGIGSERAQTVSLMNTPEGAWSPAATRKMQIDSTGGFDLGDIAPGTHRVLIIWSDFEYARYDIAVPNEPSANVVIRIPDIEIRGRVTSGVGDSTIRHAIVRAESISKPGGSSMALVDATGHYTIRLLAAGEQRLMGMQWPHPDLEAHSDAYAMESKTIVAKDGDRQELDFVIYPGAYGSVDVTSSGDLPNERMVVDVIRHGLDPSTRDSFIRTTAGGAGSWSFVGAPAGDHVGAATVRVPGGIRIFYSAPVKLELGQEARMRIELDEGIELRVRSVDPSGKPITLDSLAAFDDLHRTVFERTMLGSILNESVLWVPRGTINLNGRADAFVGEIQVDTTDGKARSVMLLLHAK